MTKRYKIKQWFKKHFTKDKVFCIICVLSIVMIVFLCVYFENKDKEQMNSKISDISFVDTDENLNKSWSINNDGNLVGENLFDITKLNDNNLLRDREISSYNVNNESAMIITTTNATDPYMYFANIITLSSGTYTFSIESSFTLQQVGLVTNYETTYTYYLRGVSSGSYTFTIEDTTSFGFGMELYEGTTNLKVMINKGSTALEWEPYGLWYSDNNYNAYGVERYNNGRASVENQFYYFDNKLIQYYTREDRFVGDEVLTQTSFTNFTINATDIIEPYYEMHEDVTFYYGKIELNILSSEFYANFIYPVSTIDGYVIIDYDDGTTYQVESYSLNREFHIYDGSSINPDKYIRYIYMQFHYDALLSIDINTSVNAVYYNNGYNAGYDKGYTNGSTASYENGRINGYNQGYNVGYNDGAMQDLTTNGFQTLCNSILSYPVNMLSQVFNFEFMGINIASTIFFLISCGIVLWIIKRLWK